MFKCETFKALSKKNLKKMNKHTFSYDDRIFNYIFWKLKRDCEHNYGIFSLIAAMVQNILLQATKLSTHIDLLLRQKMAYKHSKDETMIFD